MRKYRIWAGAIGAALVVSFSAAGYLQYRQSELLDNTRQFSTNFLHWAAFQLEKESLRLRHELERTLDDPRRLDRDAIVLRYELFVSRLRVLEDQSALTGAVGIPKHAETLRALQAFVDETDSVLGEKASVPLDVGALRKVAEGLGALADPLHHVTHRAHLYATAAGETSSELVALQNRISVALTVFQCALVLGFAIVLLRQIRALEAKRKVEELAKHLQEARHQAEAANRAKSAFLANISHELRTPFQGMLGMMALLQDSPLTPTQADWLRTAQGSAHHLLTLLNDILDISKLESGKLEVRLAPVPLPALLHDVEALMRTQALEKGLALEFRLARNLPRWVTADGTRVKQILFNLVSNAIKFTERGAVTVVATSHWSGSDAVRLRFAVRDTGVGINPATLKQLFTRFHQADPSASRSAGGAGLGLEISRSLARMMGGEIHVESTPGLGSTFSVELTLQIAQPPAAQEPDAADADPSVQLAGLRILVADDHPVNRKYLTAVLGRFGLAPRFCDNGREAVELVREHDFDVVLMDVHMPVMDGHAATRAIRALPGPRSSVRIIAMTADAFEISREEALRCGMDDFIAKPADPVELGRVLARHVAAVATAQTAPVVRALSHAEDTAPSVPRSAAWADSAAAKALAQAGWIDLERLRSLARVMSHEDYAAMADALFRDDTGVLQGLRNTLAARDPAAVLRHAHSLKGAATILGLHALARTAGAVEAAARAGAVPAFEASAARLDAGLAASRQALREIASSAT